MDYDYGSRAYTILVSIQTTNSPSGWRIETLYSYWIARTALNTKNTSWSYFIGMTNRTQYPLKIIQNKGKGDGIST
jgi:hypothetical protein